jgi:hypothetical protein
MPEQLRYRNKAAQSDIFLARYRTEMTDAGMPIPALVFWMPMPTYGEMVLTVNYSVYNLKGQNNLNLCC